ncbi:MAG: hypothetical protein HC828_03705 [Blastochloris sp.]|nr:hypothetical protein [Blastochloris sp.]
MVDTDIRAIFTAPKRFEADLLLPRTVYKYVHTAPKLAIWMKTARPQDLLAFAVPPVHRQRLCTVNCLERINKEIRRRTQVVGVFPNETSCLSFIRALPIEMGDEWKTGKFSLTL